VTKESGQAAPKRALSLEEFKESYSGLPVEDRLASLEEIVFGEWGSESASEQATRQKWADIGILTQYWYRDGGFERDARSMKSQTEELAKRFEAHQADAGQDITEQKARSESLERGIMEMKSE
jgi:hypothetical protein